MNICRKKETAGGGLLEFGAFALQVCQLAIPQEPTLVKATGKLNENGVDVDVSAELDYGDNKVATLRISMMENLSNSAKIIGTKGQITVNAFFGISNWIVLLMNEMDFSLLYFLWSSFRFRRFGGVQQRLSMSMELKRIGRSPMQNMNSIIRIAVDCATKLMWCAIAFEVGKRNAIMSIIMTVY